MDRFLQSPLSLFVHVNFCILCFWKGGPPGFLEETMAEPWHVRGGRWRGFILLAQMLSAWKQPSYFLIPLPRFLPSSLEIWVLDSLQHHISSICLPQRKTFRRLFPHSMNDSCAKILNISLLNEGPNDLNPWSDVKGMPCFRGVYLPLMVWPENTTGFISTHNTLPFLKS